MLTTARETFQNECYRTLELGLCLVDDEAQVDLIMKNRTVYVAAISNTGAEPKTWRLSAAFTPSVQCHSFPLFFPPLSFPPRAIIARGGLFKRINVCHLAARARIAIAAVLSFTRGASRACC